MLSPENIERYKIKYLICTEPYNTLKFQNAVTDFMKFENPMNFGKFDFRWLSANGTIYLNNLNTENKKITLKFVTWPFYKPRFVTIYFENQKFEIPILSKKEVSLELNLKPGKNILFLQSLNGCDSPSEKLNSTVDYRCLSVAIRTTELINDLEKQNVKVEFDKNWYASEWLYEMVVFDIQDLVHNNKDVYSLLEEIKTSCA